MFICKHCKKEFIGLSTANKANHSRWCEKNPKRNEYSSKLEYARKQIKNPRNQFIKAKDEGKEPPSSYWKGKPGTFTNKKHTPESIELIRDAALASSHRRLVKSVREYTKPDGTCVMLDSSWEEALAKRLDALGILWERPKTPIKWIDDSGKMHNYFPDFYLIEHDVFLDPKNPHALKVQQKKLKIIIDQMPNLRIIASLEECEKFIP